MRLQVAIAVVLSIASPATYAAVKKPPACTVEYATSKVELDAVQRNGRSSAAMLPVIDQLKALTEKVKGADRNSKRPIGELLAPMDAARFAELSQQVKTVRFGQYIESERARDVIFTRDMWKAARAAYETGQLDPKPADFPGVLVFLMRLLFKAPPIQVYTPTDCTVDSALVRIENRSIATINAYAPETKRLSEELDQYQRKYNGLQRDKMSETDQISVQRIVNEMQPTFRERFLVTDLENIRAWYGVAMIVYQSSLDDLTTYGADQNSMGRTLEAKRKTFDQRTQVMLGLWEKVNEKVKSEVAKETDMMSDAMKKSSSPDQAK